MDGPFQLFPFGLKPNPIQNQGGIAEVGLRKMRFLNFFFSCGWRERERDKLLSAMEKFSGLGIRKEG